jgi:hypothetical protein
MSRWTRFAARSLAVVMLLGCCTAAMATRYTNDPNKSDPNKPCKMSTQQNVMHDPNYHDANDRK